ncbi:MAG: hypothetical protein V3T05_06875 [Myxococcota bacterium]
MPRALLVALVSLATLAPSVASAQAPPPPPPPPVRRPAPPGLEPTVPNVPPPVTPTPPATPTPAPTKVAEDPVVLHARGLGLVFDGKPAAGLPLLRRAHTLAPDDELIAFDLARMARKHGGEPIDQRAVLEVEPTTSATRLLQAYVLLDNGDTDGAVARVEAALAKEPDHAEALELLRILRPDAAVTTPAGLEVERRVSRQGPKQITGRLRLSGVLDSNITVIPDSAPSQQQGYRMQVDAAAMVNLARGDFSAAVGAAVRYGPHLKDRDVLKQFDLLAAVALVTVKHTTSVLVWDFDATASEVFLNGIDDHFMQDFGAQMSVRMLAGSVQFGLYGRSGYRDFVDRKEDGTATGQDAVYILNAEGTANDRDAVYVSGGAVLHWKGGSGLSAELRAGYQTELADGENQYERGPVARLTLRWRRRDLSARLVAAYMLRDYVKRASDDERTDHRITPQASLYYALTPWFGLRLAYAMTRNTSQDDFDYVRHLGKLGVEASW